MEIKSLLLEEAEPYLSQKLFEKLHHLSTTARTSHSYEIEHDQIGWNDRLPNINAALGLSQLEIFQETLARKKQIYEIFRKGFSNNNVCKFLEHNQFGKSNHWLNSLLISNNEDNKEFKRLLYSQLSKENILIRWLETN